MLVIKNLSKKDRERIFNKVCVDKITGCWNWIGKLHTGYGYIRINGNQELLHRVMYALYVEPIPTGLPWKVPIIDHLCNNRRCCNPKHLRLISLKENILRGIGPSAINARKTHCSRGHLLPAFQNRSDGGRRCTVCQKQRDKIYWQKRKSHYVRHTSFKSSFDQPTI